jgi:hypothetical protein
MGLLSRGRLVVKWTSKQKSSVGLYKHCESSSRIFSDANIRDMDTVAVSEVSKGFISASNAYQYR